MTDRQLQHEFSGLKCEVHFDSANKALYAADASNYRQVPVGVTKPRSAEDIQEIVSICRRLELPILSRGGGTSLAGQCCNTAVIMDMSAHYNRIIRIDPDQRTAVVQPGVVLDDVRKAANKYGLTFAPDPSTHNRCTIGGMIGNNSCGVHSVMAGKTEENTHELDVLTYDGTRMLARPMTETDISKALLLKTREGEILSRLRALVNKYGDEIRRKFPNIPRRVSGYNLPELLPENGFDIAKALVGTESTCVTVLEAKLRLVPNPPKRALVVIGFLELHEAGHSIPAILKHKPVGLEGIDDYLVENIRLKHLHEPSLDWMPEGNAWLLAELGDDNEASLKIRAEALAADSHHLSSFKDVRVIFSEKDQRHIWEVREAGLGATAYVPGHPDTWEGWEDSAVPPDKVGDYLKDLKGLYKKFGYRGALYGHFGQGCIHTRINFDLVTAEGIAKFHEFIHEAAKLVTSYGGSLSGEHGDGQSKAEFLNIMYGEEIIRAFGEFKDIWDPSNKMNPGKIVRPFKNTENLRLGNSYAPWDPKTHFRYPSDKGTFTRAALRCVGVGLCRREESGVMCPSYMVTREEKHSTRGRAHLLFEMLRGETITRGWRSPEVKEALDLCLACKGCKGDCPVNVDMATYKAEFLSHYYKNRLRPRSAYAMGRIMDVARIATKMPSVFNFLAHGRVVGALTKKLAGISPHREMPKFSPQTFRETFESFANYGGPPVILWVDTFNNAFHPEIAASAQRVLQAAGYSVRLPPKQYCCGRPLYDYGFLTKARRHLEEILEGMRGWIRDGIPVVFLEPSCASVFRDELMNFFPNDQDALRLSSQSLMLSEFLLQHGQSFPWPQITEHAVVQAHCHHKSVLNFNDEVAVMKKLGMDAEVLDSGCCGMAGSFGFEDKHFDISQAVGERALYPALRKVNPGTIVVADGFSCREQIRQGVGKHAYHLAQVIDKALQENKIWPSEKLIGDARKDICPAGVTDTDLR